MSYNIFLKYDLIELNTSNVRILHYRTAYHKQLEYKTQHIVKKYTI